MNTKKNKASRRTFIKSVGYGVGALTLAPALIAIGSCFPEKEGKKLGIALVGLGGYSTGQLAPALQQTNNCYLAGIVTGTPAKADSWSKRYNIPEQKTGGAVYDRHGTRLCYCQRNQNRSGIVQRGG